MIRQTFKQALNKAVHHFPNSIQFHTLESQEIARIKAKAQAHIKANPQGKAVFDCMFRPVFH